MSQEPQGAEEIETCVRAKFSAKFQLLDKVQVNGPSTHPIFRWLRLKGSEDAAAIPWNFNLFLVERDGETCTRYANTRTPASVRDDIELALAGKPKPEAMDPTKPELDVSASESPASVLAAAS